MSLAEGIVSAQLIKNALTFLTGCERYLLLYDADPLRSNHDPHCLLSFVKFWDNYTKFLVSKEGSQIHPPSLKASVVYFNVAFAVE